MRTWSVLPRRQAPGRVALTGAYAACRCPAMPWSRPQMTRTRRWMLRRSVENLPAWAESRVATQSSQGSSSGRRHRGVPRRADATARRQPAGCGVPRQAHSGATLGQPKPPYAAETRRPSRCLKPARFQRSRSPPKSPRPSLNPKVEGFESFTAHDSLAPLRFSARAAPFGRGLVGGQLNAAFSSSLAPLRFSARARPLGADWLAGDGTLILSWWSCGTAKAAPPASCGGLGTLTREKTRRRRLGVGHQDHEVSSKAALRLFQPDRRSAGGSPLRLSL